MPSVQHIRGTRAALDALAGASGLLPGQIYVLTDQARIAVALTTSTYEAFVREGDIWDGTQAAYDALGSYDDNTTYYVAG